MRVTAVNVTAGGTGYLQAHPPKVEFKGGKGGEDAAAEATVGPDGNVVSVTLKDGGHDYLEAPTVSFKAMKDGDPGSGAKATCVIA